MVLPARLRVGARWTDVCILNISSRGLMIRTASLLGANNVIELRRGDQVIFARVVWRIGARAGLQSDECLPVDDILTLAQAPALQITGSGALTPERRRAARSFHQDSRLKGRAIEFAGTPAIAVGLAIAVFSMIESAFARPLALIRAAFGG